MDRRTVIAGCAGVMLAAPAWAARGQSAKARAIEGLALPAGFNGAVAYGRKGRVEHIRYVGLADVEAGTPIGRETRYRWGSASKWVTSVAVLRLVEQGRLALDTPITTYLPDFRADTGGQVTLAHLLSNTSGIPDLLTQAVKTDPALRTATDPAAAMVARFGGGEAAFAPGQGWDYAALNWVIVAAIVEKVTGASLASVVDRLVFQPLRMTGAGFAQVGEPEMPALAIAYSAAVPPVRKMSPAPAFVAGTGNVAGRVDDALRAADGIFHGPLLRAASRTALTSVRWPEQEYALGGRVHAVDGTRWAWEQGKVGGYRTHIAHRLDRSETVVVFNTTDMEQSAISEWVETIIRA